MYIEKNIELNQEFFFAYPVTKLKLYCIYNSHFTSSPLWNLFGIGAQRILGSYNKSVKSMLDLPYATHRSLIEPLTEQRHILKVLVNRFLAFLDNISKSSKKAIKMLLETASSVVRSVTGSNLREIMLRVGKSRVADLGRGDGDKIAYFEMTEDEIWKVKMIKEIIDVKNDWIEVEDYEGEALEEILTYLCCTS